MMSRLPEPWRKTSQDLAPATAEAAPPGRYDLYPAAPLPSGTVEMGFVALATRLAGATTAVIDGYGGVFWEDLRARLDEALTALGVSVSWIFVEDALFPASEIERLVAPFLGGTDPLFGTRFTGDLADFFDARLLADLAPSPESELSIVYGCGASLAGWSGPLVYVDVPKNEIQFRSRAGSITNLGTHRLSSPKAMYKRCYFVDWPALSRHKKRLLPRVDLMVDGQRPDLPTFVTGHTLRDGLRHLARTCFRVRPWFEPGPWGGQWIKRHIPGLPQEPPNYAWSFELIVPENGLVFEHDGRLFEVSFDCLMFQESAAVLGDAVARFGEDFPIRFDFLDTVDGGNLSLQVHPRPEYIARRFGEPFTQDETYYILDADPGARVFLGFRDDVDPNRFRAALEASADSGQPVEVESFVRSHPARKHDLFLIPSGTVHCSGIGNLVLEISATPYIFTFKMYDWLRLDLDGKPRPLNIARAFENLDFSRRGDVVDRTLLSRPRILAESPDRRVVDLPTHAEHFYGIHRLEFDREIEVRTEGSCQVMSLVEGTTVVLESNGVRRRFAYAETFVVPAAAGNFRLVNEGQGRAKVVKAFVKPTET